MSKRYPGGIIRKTPQTPSQTSAQGIWDMASVTQAVKENNWPIAGVPDPISKSLRFRSSASAYLNRTPASLGSTTTWTWSGWVKRGTLGARQGIFVSTNAVGNDYVGLEFLANDKLALIANDNSSPERLRLETNAVFRDPAAWYHIVVFFNTLNATSTNRAGIYVNNILQSYSTATYMPQSYNGRINTTNQHNIGSWLPATGLYFDGYMADVNFIDGQALTPSSFGSTNDQTGVWQPIVYTGTYGTNGFYLPFSNTASTATLGYDFSGNSNNWTTNNISLTSGSTYDSMVDVPTQWIPYNTAGDTGALFRGNYCTMNPLQQGSGAVLSQGNLNIATPGGAVSSKVLSTIGMTTGKWYCEMIINSSASNYGNVGLGRFDTTFNSTSYLGNDTTSWCYAQDGNIYTSGTGTAYGNTYTAGDIIGIAFDADNGKLFFSKNGTFQNSGNPVTGTNPAVTSLTSGPYFFGQGASPSNVSVNFGQRPFSYTPPSGFKTLCTTNLSTPTIGATASTQANDYFNAVLYTGTGSSQSITGLDFQPDLVWIKSRNNAGANHLIDAVRGIPLFIFSDSTAGDTSRPNSFTSFNSNGFTVGSSSDGNTNLNTYTYVAWNWKANGSGSTNTAGTITSTVSANTTAGFSIVTYTGNATNGATVGHGLGVSPSMIIGKIRSTTGDWYVWQTAMGDNFMRLNTTAAQVGSTANGVYNTASFSSTVFALGSSSAMNASGGTFVAYCFAQVAGYSAFGSYTGNGSSDGAFVFLGFRARYVMIKCSSSTGGWVLLDTARDPYNDVDNYLYANSSAADAGSSNVLDINANGFKIRNSWTDINGSGTTYIYMAFAESPFKFALAR